MDKILSFAKDLYNKTNLNFIPVADKRPLIRWGQGQKIRFSWSEIEFMLKNHKANGLGLICGFDRLVALDFDAHGENEVHDISSKTDFTASLLNKIGEKNIAVKNAIEFLDFFSRIAPLCYLEITKNKGIHVLFKTPNPPPKSVLKTNTDGSTSVELLGAGSLVIVAPSVGYLPINGSLFDLPLVSEHDFENIITYFLSQQQADVPNSSDLVEKVLRVALESGFVVSNSQDKNGRFIRIKRVGTSKSVSASIFRNSGCVYCFSTNIPQLEPNKVYSPVEFVATLRFNGNTTKAAKFLGLSSQPQKVSKSNCFLETEEFLNDLGSFRYDKICKKIEMRKHNETHYVSLSSLQLEKIYTDVRKSSIVISYENFLKILHSLAECFNPFEDYLKNLNFNIDSNPFTDFANFIKTRDDFESLKVFYLESFFLSATLLGLEKRGLDVMLVLQGKQGVGKTTLLRHFCPKKLSSYYAELGFFPSEKELHYVAATSLLINIDDLDSLSGNKLNSLKSLISGGAKKIRFPYETYPGVYWIYGSFMGSVNAFEFLHDFAGYRRFLILPILKVDFDFLNFNIDTLWFWTYQKVLNNSYNYLSVEDFNLISQINSEFEQTPPEVDMLKTVLRKPTPSETPLFLTRTNIIQILTEVFPKERIQPYRVSEALRSLGFENTHTKRGRYYKVAVFEPYLPLVQFLLQNPKVCINDINNKAVSP